MTIDLEALIRTLGIRKHRRRTIAFGIVWLGLFCQFAQAQEETLRIERNLVTVPFSVMDRDGRFITDVKKEQVSILEDGQVQHIDFLTEVSEPLTVMLLVDISPSMANHYDHLLGAINLFVHQLRPVDRVTAITFDDGVDTIVDSTLVSVLGSNIRIHPKLKTQGTYLFDAVESSMKRLKKVRGRKALILFSDGVGDGIATAKGTLRQAEENEAPIYTVQFGKFSAEPPPGRSRKFYLERVNEINGYMTNLALVSGGRSFHIEDISSLAATFRDVSRELTQQYSLSYYPSRDDKHDERRKIKVKVDLPNVAVRSRNEVVYKKSR